MRLKDPVFHEVMIDFDGNCVYWDAVAMPNHDAVEAKLAEVAAVQPVEDQPEVRIKPNKFVDYGSVAKVMASAQRLQCQEDGHGRQRAVLEVIGRVH